MRPSSLLAAVALVVLVAGCSNTSATDGKPAAPDDVTAPAVALTTAVGRYDVVRGEQTLEVDATDDVAVVRTELYVDGEMVAEAAEAPFALTWDSATVADGERLMKVVAYDAAGNQAETEEVPVFVVNGGKTPTFDEFPKAVDGQLASTFKVPADWDGNDEVIDLKYHFTMPAGVKRLVAVLQWDASQGFKLDFSSGTGFCPDSGVMKVQTIENDGEALLIFEPGDALEQTGWFVHVGAANASTMKGKSVPFTERVVLFR
jgi:hypothetical protein